MHADIDIRTCAYMGITYAIVNAFLATRILAMARAKTSSGSYPIAIDRYQKNVQNSNVNSSSNQLIRIINVIAIAISCIT